MEQALIDRLMDMSHRHADQIAELWYKSLSTNQHTTSFLTIPKAVCLRHSALIYSSLADMYFAKDCFHAVEETLDVSGFVEDFFARSIPLEELLYSLVLLRRHVWLFADSQAIFNPSVTDLYNALDGINRVLLVFDYAEFIVAKKYRKMESRLKQGIRSGN